MKFALSHFTAIGLVLAIAPATSAFAADAPQAATEDGKVQEVIITAQRRAQANKDVGVALSVLSGKELQRRGVTTVNDLQYQTPSLEITPAFGGGQPQFRLRGVGFDDYASNNTPTVGIYVDEVAYPVPAATQGVIYDIDRVEVLRGPQGTLYGRNTTGGAINFVTRRPTDTFQAGFTADYSSYNHFLGEGYISGPLGDDVKGRLSFATEQGGAWQENRVTGEKLGDADKLAVRGQLEWQKSDGFDLLLNFHAGQDKSDAQGGYLLTPFATKSGAGVTYPADTDHTKTGWGVSDTFAAIAGISPDSKPGKDNASSGLSITANWQFANARLTSITAYDTLRRRELNDWDASDSHESDTFWHSDVDVFSQEIRLASTGADKLKWLVGAYYSDQTLKEKFLTDFSDSYLAAYGFAYLNTHYTQHVKSVAAFGQVEYKLSPRLNLIGGLRYETENRKLQDFRTSLVSLDVDTFTDGDRHAGLNQFSGKAALEFKPVDSTLLYASVSRGVKSGGFTAYNSPGEHSIDAFRPEILVAYEAGFKSQLANNLYLNGAIFHYDYTDQQVLTTVIDPQAGAVGRISNAPKSKIDGVELEAVWTPVKGLNISQTLAYKKGEYVEFNDVNTAAVVQDPVTHLYSAGTIDRSGQDLGFPKLSYNGAVSYNWHAAGSDWRIGTDYSYRDKLDSWLGDEFDIKAYWLANADLSIHPDNSRFAFSVYGRNIFDTQYDVTRNYFLASSKVGWAGKPATYGVRLQYTY
jgi:iron complex outermembrane receptor protein